MRANYLRLIISVSVLLMVIWTGSCSGGSGSVATADDKSSADSKGEASLKMIKMVLPDENTGFKLHEQIKVELAIVKENVLPDSVRIYFDGKSVATLTSGPWQYTIPESFTVNTGRKSLKAVAYGKGRQQNTVTRFMIIYSDIVPAKYGYKVINTYPHDRKAFTQGLVYDDGVLYEGTGQESGSSLRKVELTTGKILMQHNLDASLFGEGITIYNNRIFQVTWENKVGFVYKKSDFELINKIYYPTQGWGLTTIGDRIVMSDGSNVLYFYEPELFTVVSRLEVYDNSELVDSLNELEYINGEIWANIWMTDKIARIDPESGRVNGYIYLKGLLPEADRDPDTNVLNGIAYDSEGKRIFVTGKYWPKLFEIKVTE